LNVKVPVLTLPKVYCAKIGWIYTFCVCVRACVNGVTKPLRIAIHYQAVECNFSGIQNDIV